MENRNDGRAEAIVREPVSRRWKIYLDRCTLCGECIDACLPKLLQIKNKMVVVEDGCTQCGDCAAACGQYAITFS